MQGDRKAIAHLNKALFNALTAINQFFLHARMFGNWGLEELDERDYKESIRQMRQADRLIGRILFLEGTPDMRAEAFEPGRDVEEMLEKDLATEYAVRAHLAEGIALCERHGDYVTRDLLLAQLKDTEEDHAYWLEKQLRLIRSLGLALYQQSKLGGDA